MGASLGQREDNVKPLGEVQKGTVRVNEMAGAGCLLQSLMT